MKYNTEKTMAILQAAGIDMKYTTFMKWVREGKIKGEKSSTKSGYRFNKSDIESFMKEYKIENDGIKDPFEENRRLRKENSELRHRINLPDSFLKAENIKLTKRIKELEEEVIKLKEDKTIYVRVR